MSEAPEPLDSFSFLQDSWGSYPLHAPTPPRAPTPIKKPPAQQAPPRSTEGSWRPLRAMGASQRFGPPPAYVQETWDRSALDWTLVKDLRIQVTNQLTEARPAHTTEEEEQALGRRIIAESVQRYIADEMRRGNSLDHTLTATIEEAVYDALFGLGRLQPLVDSEWIENIEIHGHDVVHIELVDGTLCDGPAIAESDDELIEDLQFWASRSKANPRPFSPASPTLNLPLGEYARLAAMAWVTEQPIVTIRLHRMVDTSFEDLIDKETITPLMANFLTAVVQSGASIVVSGAQGAGKTTLCRALCSALPPTERLITFETDRELHLNPERHPRSVSVESRLGSGEFRPDGREAGVFELIEGLRESLRHNADRLLVGEVRGGEIIAMLQAMQSGTGSISTTHARSARNTFNKLVTCALEVPGISEAYANRAIASSINFVAFIKKVNIKDGDAIKRVRRVTEIVSLELTSDGVAYSDVFSLDRAGQARAHTVPPYVEDLVDAGFDYDHFVIEANAQQWGEQS